jgi:hypothetical protein
LSPQIQHDEDEHLAVSSPIVYTLDWRGTPKRDGLDWRRQCGPHFCVEESSQMRAVIRCRTNVEPQALDALLSERDWWPNLPQEHEVVQERKQEILDQVKEGDRDIAEGTHLYTIYDAETRSWGIISNPTKGLITFRIKNPVSDRLKKATEKLIYDFQVANPTKMRKDGICFDFHPMIEVLEPNSTNHAYSGEIIPSNKLRFAVQQRKIEASVGLIAALFAVLFSLLTIPSIRSPLFQRLPTEWFTWLSGFMERLATSSIVVATISWLNLLLHWLELRRKGLVSWSLD